MGDSYNFTAVRLFAKHIVDNIGEDAIYSNKNTFYPNAPANYYLADVLTIGRFVKRTLEIPREIQIIPDSKADSNIHGFLLDSDKFLIVINSNLNTCWFRFALLKELCSIFVDHYQVKNGLTTFDNFLDSLKNAFDQKNGMLTEDGLDYGDLDSETFAILLATELMIPIYKRDITLKLLDRVDKDLTLNDIAKSLMIPETVLKLFIQKKYFHTSPAYADFN